MYQMHSASKYSKTPLPKAQEVYNHLKSHITKLEEVAMCLKLPSDVVSEIMKTRLVDTAPEAIIQNGQRRRRKCAGTTLYEPWDA